MNPALMMSAAKAVSGKAASAAMSPRFIMFLIGLGVVLFIYFTGKRTGKLKEMMNRGQDAQFPTSGQGIPTGWTPDTLVAQLHSAIDGVDFFMSNDDKKAAYGALVNLSDDQVVAVYNAFNKLYGKVSNGKYTYTLYNWIEDDSGDDSKVRALAVLERLGLK